MAIKIPEQERRTREELKEHYEIEKELADRLRNSTREQRRQLYSSTYDELYKRVPSHPQLTRKHSREVIARGVARRMRLLRRYLRASHVFLELGAGDCSLSFEVAKHARKVLAVDVSAEITRHVAHPENFELIISDGCSIPVPEGSVDVAYSNQLIEHLHPDDAVGQLQNVHKALAPTGIYICITSNRLSGPHDISKYFDEVATGLHLKEYTFGELGELLRKAGFSSVQAYIGLRGAYLRCPLFFVHAWETMACALPPKLKKIMTHRLPFRAILETVVVVGMR